MLTKYRNGSSTPRISGRASRAFTLIEMLAVMGVIVLLVSLAGPAFTSLQGASNINRAVYDISGLLGQARAYAMSNNTYVYVGIAEVDIGQASSSKPKQAGVGKVAVAVIASKDGSRGYSVTSDNPPAIAGWTGAQAGAARGFFLVGKPQTFDNLHLADLGRRSLVGPMTRPPYNTLESVAEKYNLGNPACVSATPFNCPVGGAPESVDYQFTKVIQYSPQGVARIQRGDNSDIVVPWLEIGLQQTHGSTFSTPPPPVTTGAVAVVQINGLSGAARIYRP